MLIELIWLCLLIIGILLSLHSIRYGLLYYLFGAIVFPVLRLGDIAVRFELVYCMWLFIIIVINRMITRPVFKWNPVLSLYALFLAAVIAATLLALPTVEKVDIFGQSVMLYGLLRPLLVIFLFLNVRLDEAFARRVLWLIIWLSIPLALFSIAQVIDLSIAEKVTTLFYASPARTPIFALIEETGSIIRACSVFESPLYNAAYFLFVLLASGIFLVTVECNPFQRRILYVSLGMATIGGIITLTSTFFIGIILSICLIFLIVRPRFQVLFSGSSAVTICIVIALILALLLITQTSENTAFVGTLKYQIHRILSGSVLETRYDPETGFLLNTYQAILKRPLLGWGLFPQEGVFVGDSLYLVLLYRGGLVGFGLFFLIIYGILRYTWKQQNAVGMYGITNQIVIMYTLLLLVIGVGQTAFFTMRIQELYWALVGMGLNRAILSSNLTQTRRMQ